MRQSPLYILWLEGMNPDILDTIPSTRQIAQDGIDVQLIPQPPVEQWQCYYQFLTGMGAGKLGRYDAVRASGYTAQPEATIAEGAAGHLLQDVLRARGISTSSLEVTQLADLDALIEQSYDVVLIRVHHAADLPVDTLDTFVERCISLAGPAAHIGVVTDVWESKSHTSVNVNDFLADVGLLEVATPRPTADIVWNETLAYGLGTGQVWINLKGREPKGIVSAGREYKEVCDALVRELSTSWLNPQTGQPIVARVFKKEELYSGDYLFKAPDLTIVYQPGYATSPHAYTLDFDGQSVLVSETHTESSAQPAYARLLARGPMLVQGENANGQLVDVVPTFMYLLGQPIPSKVDGKVLQSIFTAAYKQQYPLQWAEDEMDQLSAEEEGLVVDRLRDLGYL